MTDLQNDEGHNCWPHRSKTETEGSPWASAQQPGDPDKASMGSQGCRPDETTLQSENESEATQRLRNQDFYPENPSPDKKGTPLPTNFPLKTNKKKSKNQSNGDLINSFREVGSWKPHQWHHKEIKLPSRIGCEGRYKWAVFPMWRTELRCVYRGYTHIQTRFTLECSFSSIQKFL